MSPLDTFGVACDVLGCGVAAYKLRHRLRIEALVALYRLRVRLGLHDGGEGETQPAAPLAPAPVPYVFAPRTGRLRPRPASDRPAMPGHSSRPPGTLPTTASSSPRLPRVPSRTGRGAAQPMPT